MKIYNRLEHQELEELTYEYTTFCCSDDNKTSMARKPGKKQMENLV